MESLFISLLDYLLRKKDKHNMKSKSINNMHYQKRYMRNSKDIHNQIDILILLTMRSHLVDFLKPYKTVREEHPLNW